MLQYCVCPKCQRMIMLEDEFETGFCCCCGTHISFADARDELLHTVACKAAIKAGRRHDTAELERIAAAVAAGEVRYCPHGRPICVTLSKKQLEKQFKRT